MNSHRKKPFSNKQKKKQLQEKRAKKNDRQSTRDADEPDRGGNNSHYFSDSEEKKPQTEALEADMKENGHGQDNAKQHDVHKVSRDTKGLVINRLRSVFEKLTPNTIEGLRLSSMQPLHRLPQTSLETSFEDVYPTIMDFPRRPAWSYDLSKKELEEKEQQYFDAWMETIYSKYPSERLSWFEHNLEVWRQLWRVFEISDIILIIVDVRHPILHFPPSLYHFVVGELKRKLVVVFNKVDLVAEGTLYAWRKYFEQYFPQLHVASFSAYPRDEKLINDSAPYAFQKRMRRPRKRYYRAWGVKGLLNACRDVKVEKDGVRIDWEELIRQYDRESEYGEDEEEEEEEKEEEVLRNRRRRSEDDRLAEKAVEKLTIDVSDEEATPHKDYITIGLVGHPNVGKSSLINSVMGRTVVSASQTPGHTKHFQTIHLTANVRLCDGPGLVFPSLLPRPLQILSGMYPIAQVQEPYSTVQYLAERVPLEFILKIQPPSLEESKEHQWSAWSICEEYAIQRGLYTAKAARPDVYRAANTILRFANDGRILLSFKPPGFFTTTKYEKLRVQDADRALTEDKGERAGDDEYEQEREEERKPSLGKGAPKVRTGGFFELLSTADSDEGEESEG